MPSTASLWIEHPEEALRQLAHDHGFDACAIARAHPVDHLAAQRYQQWINNGMHGPMTWAERYADVRDDPAKLLPGAQSVVMLAMNYLPPTLLPAEAPQFARYAYGRDYHKVVRAHLRDLAAQLTAATGARCRCAVDTAPLRERYWAQQAGLGFIGRNHQLIIPQKGSYFFLGAIITTAILQPDKPLSNKQTTSQAIQSGEAGALCGNCRRCIDACPVGALAIRQPLDARRCLSCLTIEHHGPLPKWLSTDLIDRNVYGCDKCQLVCPHNQHAVATAIADFHPTPDFMAITRSQLLHINDDEFNKLFGHSAVRRAGPESLRRNAERIKP